MPASREDLKERKDHRKKSYLELKTEGVSVSLSGLAGICNLLLNIFLRYLKKGFSENKINI